MPGLAFEKVLFDDKFYSFEKFDSKDHREESKNESCTGHIRVD